MGDFKDKISTILKSSKKKSTQNKPDDPLLWKRMLGAPQEGKPYGLIPEEALSQVASGQKKFDRKCLEIAKKIIEVMNSDKVTVTRRETFDTDIKKIIIALMVERIIFTIDRCTFSHVVHGNDFDKFSKALRTISNEMKIPNNAYYLQDDPEVGITLDAIQAFFAEKKKKGQGRRTNLLSADIALRIYYAWKHTGYHASLDYTDDGKSLPKTSFAVFADTTSALIKDYIQNSASKKGNEIFIDLRGVRKSLKHIKSRKIKSVELPFLIQ